MSNPDDPLDFLDAFLTDLFADAQAYHDKYVKPMRELAQQAGAEASHVEQLELTWDRVIRTQQNVLLRLSGVPIRAGKPAKFSDYPESTGAPGNPLPAEELVENLTGAELVEAIEACEISLEDCRRAVRSLQTRDGSGLADYWLGDSAPSHLFRQYGAWFEGALATLRRLRQHRALADHREGTQFKPLDAASPTVVLRVKVPKYKMNVVDVLAEAAGQSRSEYVRSLIDKAVSEANLAGSLFADADALHARLQRATKRR